MQLSLTYTPKVVEAKWYAHWLQQGFFQAKPQPHKPPYTIVMPPPNITGSLHMGHLLNNTIQDILIRKARMEGKEACWVPGIDHAAIATEAKVVAMLKEQGISKSAIHREAFLQHAWAWKKKYGGLILDQLKKLGVSCDWNRTRFTLDESHTNAVQSVFIQLYEKGYIYQGTRMVHWDPIGKTALSDDEVVYKAVPTKLYYIRYTIVDSTQHVTIATTRPETILGDTAVCIHPNDTRYQHLKEKKVLVPLINRMIPVIEDDYVDKDFGTGCLKVTPAHDMNDYTLGKKHNLAVIDLMNEDGTFNEAAQHYLGEDRHTVRKKIVQQLKEQGHLVKIVDYTHNVGFSERTHAMVEPRISTQWFVEMQQIAQPALKHVLDGTIQFHPAKFKNSYQAWLTQVKDWCISRQLWWGHRIPAYYLPDGTVIVAKDLPTALAKARAQPGYAAITAAELQQDEDVLDTWFSSWLWPITVFDGLKDPQNEAIRYFYPTQALVTAPDIIFFWVARMIMAGYEFHGKPPFRHVYFTGIVRDPLGRKMSKSLGNSPDPLDLIQQYSADGVRVGMLFSAPAGNDLLFDTKLCAQGQKFAHKIWHAFRLLQSWQLTTQPATEHHDIAIQWFAARLNQVLEEVENHFQQFRISDALMTIYKFIWDDFCSWYLEMIKPAHGQTIVPNVYEATQNYFASSLKLLHPFMPFITEELWHHIKARKEQDCLIVASWPKQAPYNKPLLNEAIHAFALIKKIRSLRSSAQIEKKQPLMLYTLQAAPTWLTHFMPYIKKLAHISQCTVQHTPVNNATSFSIQSSVFYVPLGQKADQEKEKTSLLATLAYTKGFLATVMKKLHNTQFVQQAPEQVVAMERKKQADARTKIKLLEERLAQLQ